MAPGAGATHRFTVPLALGAVYVIWGSTYLGIRFAVEGFPPLLMGGMRFTLASCLMFWFARSRGRAWPTARQWRTASVLGVLFFVGGVGLVTVAEDLGVGSGLAASLVAVMPLWTVIFGRIRGEWPHRLEWVGLIVGFAGVVLLTREGDFGATTAGLVLMIVAPVIWAFGSVVAMRADLPEGSMATAVEMLSGGLGLLLAAVVGGERITEAPGAGAWLALAYLITFGSVVAYGSYMFLLKAVRPAVATSYAYVNPVVAVLLGVSLGSEALSAWTLVGLPLVLAGVALVAGAQRRRARRLVVLG